MGCDIHLYAEKKVFDSDDEEKRNGSWISIDKWSVNEDLYRYKDETDKRKMVVRYEDRYYRDRNYNLFTALAGVRNYFNNNPPIISEPKGFPKDACKEVRAEKRRWDGDGHSHSWLTLAELKAFDWSAYGTTCNEFVVKAIPKLEDRKSHYNTDEDIRIVFWFDN